MEDMFEGMSQAVSGLLGGTEKTFVVANYSVSDCLPRPVSCTATSYGCLLVEACGRSGSSSGTWGAMLKLR